MSFVLHLARRWRPEFGGSLVWCSPFHVVPAEFNALTLFGVSAHSAHFVSPVWPEAAPERRLAVSGWLYEHDAEEMAAWVRRSDAHNPSRQREAGVFL